MKRRLLLILVATLALLLLMVLLLPWWWGAALRTAGGRFGLQFAEYRTEGYNRWVLEDVAWQRPGVQVSAGRVEADHPLRWALRPGSIAGPRVEDWVVTLEPGQNEAPAAEPEPGGWRTTYQMIEQVERALTQWLPQAELGSGVIRWPGGEVAVERARWSDRQLRVEGVQHRGRTASAVVRWDEAVAVEAATEDDEWRLNLELREPGIKGVVAWRDQPAEFAAVFPATGWMPEEARLTATGWEIPGSLLRVEDYYASVTAEVKADWRDGGGQVDLRAHGQPREGADVPPLQVVVDAEGDQSQITVRALQAQAPGLEAILDQPVTFNPRGEFATAATFRLEADLAEFAPEGVAGRLAGRVQVRPRGAGAPDLEAEVQLADGAYGTVSDVAATAAARLQWPILTVASTEWLDGAGTAVEMGGRLDLAARRVEEAQLRGEVLPASVAPWLPAGMAFERIAVEATASGAWNALQHQGTLEVAGWEQPGLQPLQARGSWTGQLAEVAMEATVQAPRATAELQANIAPTQATLTRLEVRQREQEIFRLQQPATVRWAPHLQLDALHLQGPALEAVATVTDFARQQLDVTVPRMQLRWLQDWIVPSLPVRTLHDVRVQSELRDDVLHFSVAGAANLLLADEYQIALDVRLAGGGDGIAIESLEATSGGEAIIVLTGHLPIQLQPGQPEPLSVDENGELTVQARVAPSPGFWSAVAAETGVTVEQPRVEIDLKGNWSDPVGAARIQAEKIAFAAPRWGERMPVITGLNALLEGNDEGLRLERFQVAVEGQSITAGGQLPLTPDQWEAARRAPFDYMREHARGFIEVPEAEVAKLSRLAPAILAPTGIVRARLEFPGEGQVRGALELQGAASRPLGPLGVLQDIRAELTFKGREVEVRTMEAAMGGQTVRLNGRAVLVENEPPHLDLRLRGQNLPLVRETGVILRSDLDLALVVGDQGRGRVSGTVRLRDGLFLADLQDVIPRGGGGARPSARPPYFSVPMEPLNQWRLDVAVEGDDFMRLRTPVLTGTASARFQLSGTLGQPRAIGEATVDEGRIKLPFATFAIQDGEVRLTQADPYQPQLAINATSRRMGYDLRMEVSGTASEPRVQFFSSPPLPSEDIVLLVMAGQAPQDEISRTGSQRAMAIGTFLGRGVLGDLFGGDGGGDRLTYTSGEKISRQGRETQSVALELTPRLSLVGEYDEFDSYNAGIRWRLLPRREPGEEEENEP